MLPLFHSHASMQCIQTFLMKTYGLQVIFTTACELVTPKHVVPGTLKILQGQIQFTGDPPAVAEGTSATAPENAASRTKVPSRVFPYALMPWS